MPSDWIRDKAEQENRERAESRANQEAQQREMELIRAIGPEFVENLRKVLDGDITAWNANFKDRQINGTGDSANGFNVTKFRFPQGTAGITFNPATLTIDVVLVRSTMRDPNQTYETKRGFSLKANPDGRGIHMVDLERSDAHLQPSRFSQMILESIAEPLSHHIV